MEFERTGRVVVGVDNTLSGLQALRYAVAEARVRGVPLQAVRAWRAGPTPLYPELHSLQYEEVAAASQLVARAFADTMGGLPKDLEVETVLVPDSAGPVLTRYASRPDDLLVIGCGRRGVWRRRSRVARYCVAHAACPVLVVPPPPLTQSASAKALLRQLRRDIDHLASNGSAG